MQRLTPEQAKSYLAWQRKIEREREREREQYFQRENMKQIKIWIVKELEKEREWKETGNQCGQRRLGRETDVSNTAKLTKDIILMMELFSCHRQKEIENVYKGKRLTVLEREREREVHAITKVLRVHALNIVWLGLVVIFFSVPLKRNLTRKHLLQISLKLKCEFWRELDNFFHRETVHSGKCRSSATRHPA